MFRPARLSFLFLVCLHQKVSFRVAKARGKNSPPAAESEGRQRRRFILISIRTRCSPIGLKYPFDTSRRLHNTQLQPNTDVPAACRDQRSRDWSEAGRCGRSRGGSVGIDRSRRDPFVSRQKSPGWQRNKAPSARRLTPAGSQGPKSRERKTTTTTTNKQTNEKRGPSQWMPAVAMVQRQNPALAY